MTASIAMWLAAPMSPEVKAALQRIAELPDVAHIAVMPDVHLATTVCVGTVIATNETLFPAAIGGDIGCGVAALRFDGDSNWLADRRHAARVLAGIGRVVPAIRHGSRRAALPDSIDIEALSHPRLRAMANTTGRLELGTVGRGNHFVELQTDEEDRVWLMVHSGSRALGQAIRDHHQPTEGASGALRGVAASSNEGAAYVNDLRWALTYADANRRAMVDAVARVLGDLVAMTPDATSWISCHHNFARHERHGDAWYWVHRKGAISASDQEPGLIPGSMGTSSCHVLGRGHPASLRSSSHGAGRRFSRGEAKRRISDRAVIEQLGSVWFDHRLVAHLRDEAPGAYNDIEKVMRAQRELTRIVRRVTPRLVYKGT